jgi:DTW domain-containing protein YfiP
MDTRTCFVFLMHPKEFKEEKANTGRLTHLCLPNSKIHMGAGFDSHEEVQELLRDPKYYPVLVYPGPNAINLSQPQTALTSGTLGGRTLLVLLLDATWACARKMLRLSMCLQQLPRVMFTPTTPSRYVIKQQPQEGCLSTLETVHELLVVLERAQLDTYSMPGQLLSLFQRMQDFQIRCANDPTLPGYRKKPYGDPKARSVSKRRKYIK